MDRKSQILVVVEGEKTDYKLMEHLLSIYGISESHEIVPYRTNIYTLYNEMFRDGDPYSVDLLQLLKEREANEEQKKIFDRRYSDVLLIFDLDPQAPDFSADKILEMINFFVESSDMGKLYINYPMVESFYHMKSIPDEDYNSYVVSLEELHSHQYKARVARENRNKDYRKFAVDKQECSIVIQQNVDKAFLISRTEQSLDETESILPESASILKAQLRKMEHENSLSVLCTSAFYIADYNPSFLNN